ncbi:MAG: DMT family transporter [Lachnospirales bacterium]
MNKLENKGYLLVVLAGGLWGSIGLFINLMTKCGSSIELTGFLRMFFSFVILFMVSVLKYGIKVFKISKKSLLYCGLLGILCHGIYNVFYNYAVVISGVMVSAVLLNIAPVFTAILSVLFFRERFTFFKFIALIINIFGCMLTATGGNFNIVSLSIFGILCGVGAGFCYSLTSVLGKFAGENNNPFVISTYSYLFAAVFFGFYMIRGGFNIYINQNIITLGILYALIPTSIGYLLYYSGVARIKENSKVPILASGESVVAAIIGIFLLNENINYISIIGIILTLFSILLIQSKKAVTN